MSQLTVLVVRFFITFLVLLPFTQKLLAVQTTPPLAAPGTVRMLNELFPFDWAGAEDGFGRYTSANTEYTSFSEGLPPHSSVIQNGELHVQATSGPSGTSYEAHFISLRGHVSETHLTVDLADPLPREVLPPYRVRVRAIRVRVRGQGRYKIEVKGPDGSFLYLDLWKKL